MIKAGGVIYNQGTGEVALVRMLDGQVCFVSAKMSRNGDVSVEDLGMPLSDCRPATAEEKFATTLRLLHSSSNIHFHDFFTLSLYASIHR